MHEDLKEFLISLPFTALILYLIFSNQDVQDYMNCADVPAYARTYETCF